MASEASTPGSLLDELRAQYESSRQHTAATPQAEGFHAIDARMRKAFRWLERAISYLDELKLPLAHRFELGHGIAFDAPRFTRGSVTQHEQRIVGFPVLDDLVRLILGRDAAFLRRAPLAGLHRASMA